MKPSMRAFERFAKITLHRYERYLPTAFDESLTLLEKMNKLIEYLNAMGVQLNDVVDQWNEVMEWIINDGINDVVLDRLDDMVDDGTFETLINETVFEGLNDKINTVEDEVTGILNRYVNQNVVLRVPSEFPSITDALRYTSQHHTSMDIRFEILLESGYQISSRTHVYNGGDYSMVRLSSEDDVVFLADNFPNTDLFHFSNTNAFRLNCLIDARGRNQRGISLQNSSTMFIEPYCGVINSGRDNLYVRHSSRATATYGIFTGAGQETNTHSGGITAWGGSSISAYGADASNSLSYGVRSAHGSVIEFDDGKCTDCVYHNIRASQGARVNCRNSDARRAGMHGIYALDASIIHADNSDVSGANSNGFYAHGGSTIQAAGSIANNCGGNGARAYHGSTLSVSNLQANDCGNTALRVAGASTVYARNSEFNSSGGRGVYVTEHSYVHIQNSGVSGNALGGIIVEGMSNVNASVCTVTSTQPGNTNAHGVNVRQMSTLSFAGSLCFNNGGVDIRIEGGSRVRATNTRTTQTRTTEIREPHINDTNVSSFNTQTAFGVVYR